MSISDQITRCCDAGLLVEHKPVVPGSNPRVVYLMPSVADQIKGPWATSEEARLMPRVQADLDVFSEGEQVTATFKKWPNATFKRLIDQQRTVWEIRTIDPKPGVRTFGMFAMQDVFVGFGLLVRSELPDESDFNREINNAKARWRNLFVGYTPVVSERIHDYISENVVELPRP